MTETLGVSASSERAAVIDGLRAQITRAGISERALSIAIGRNPGWLNSLLKRGAVPNALDWHKMAVALNCGMEDLFKKPEVTSPRTSIQIMSDQITRIRRDRGFDRPEIYQVIAWHSQSQGRIRQDDWLREYYELFAIPGPAAKTPDPKFVGQRSLTALELQLGSCDELRRFFESSDLALRQHTAETHRRVFGTGKPDLSSKNIEFVVGGAITVRVEYMRILLPVRDEKDAPYILNYSKPTKRIEIAHSEALDRHESDRDFNVKFLESDDD